MEQILNILHQFDGYGLVITDVDLLKERFKAMQEWERKDLVCGTIYKNKIKDEEE